MYMYGFDQRSNGIPLTRSQQDRNLEDLFRLYGATRWQRLRLLLVPSALPYFLAGLRIAGGLSLIGDRKSVV